MPMITIDAVFHLYKVEIDFAQNKLHLHGKTEPVNYHTTGSADFSTFMHLSDEVKIAIRSYFEKMGVKLIEEAEESVRNDDFY